MISEIDNEVGALLSEWKVCWRCIIRFTDRNIDFDSFEESKPKEDWICYVCTGILQQSLTNSDIVDKIKATIMKSNFKYNSFQVVVSTPINSFIREFAVLLALKDKFPNEYETFSADDIVQIKSVWRSVMKSHLTKSLEKTYVNGNQVQMARNSNDCLLENDFLIVNINFNHDKEKNECAVLSELEPEVFKRRRKGEHRYKWDLFTRKITDKILKNTSKERFQRYFGLPPYHNKNDIESQFSVEISRQDPVFVAGRYLKLSRRLPQSPWILDGVRKLESSVEELISEKLVETFNSADSCFIASGREDVDVRMLGKGRPFVVELRNCKNLVQDVIEKIDTLEKEVNDFCTDKVVVRDLKIISKGFVSLIKDGEQNKSKWYRMVVWCENGIDKNESELALINETRDLVVQQLTPIRVLHRRSLIDRPRTFYSFSARRLDHVLAEKLVESNQSVEDYSRFLDKYNADQLFMLTLRCQAGSYVKEFVHGDLGRTQPNLATILGQQCDILALDVLEIELDWPPKC